MTEEIERSRKKVELAILANGGDIHREHWCRCDPSIGAVPCQYCAIFNGLNEAKTLLSSLEKEKERADHLRIQLDEATYYNQKKDDEIEKIKEYDSKIPFGIGVVNRKIYRKHIDVLLTALDQENMRVKELTINRDYWAKTCKEAQEYRDRNAILAEQVESRLNKLVEAVKKYDYDRHFYWGDVMNVLKEVEDL